MDELQSRMDAARKIAERMLRDGEGEPSGLRAIIEELRDAAAPPPAETQE